MKWILLLISTLAHGKKSKQPCWITQPCDPYDSATYVVGVGSGKDLVSAEANAMGAITRQFVIDIQQRQSAIKEVSETRRGDASGNGSTPISASENQSLRSRTIVESGMQLYGAEIVERYEKDNQHYALAVINREQWSAQISTERRSLGQQLSQLKMQAQATDHLLERQPIFRQMLPLAEADEELATIQKLLNPESPLFPSSDTAQSISASIAQNWRSLGIVAVIEEGSTDWSNELYHCGTEAQLSSASSSDSSAVIQFKLQSQRNEKPKDSFGFVHVIEQINVTVAINDRVLYTSSLKARSSSQSRQQALDRLTNSVQQELCPQMKKWAEQLRNY